MPKKRTRKQRLSIIEIPDSSDSQSQSSNQKPTKRDAPDSIPPNDDADGKSSTKSTASYTILTRRKLEEQLPVACRTKNATKGGVSMRLVSLDFLEGGRESLSVRSQENMTKLSRIETTKKPSIKDEIHKVVQQDMDDPELTPLLKKIAYCRVFTNYLFRQYDMLSIDFQLYSDFDDLMMDLKRRVGAYNAIRRSRKQILLGEGGGGGGASSSREGSTL